MIYKFYYLMLVVGCNYDLMLVVLFDYTDDVTLSSETNRLDQIVKGLLSS